MRRIRKLRSRTDWIGILDGGGRLSGCKKGVQKERGYGVVVSIELFLELRSSRSMPCTREKRLHLLIRDVPETSVDYSLEFENIVLEMGLY